MSSDLEKLEALLPKLVHFLPNIRLRNASSLLFKIESGLLTHVIQFNSTYVQMIVDSITESMSLIIRENNEWKNSTSAEAQTITTLCMCLSAIGKNQPDNTNNTSAANFSRVLKALFSLQSYGILEGNSKTHLENAISNVASIGSPRATSSSSSTNAADTPSISYSESIKALTSSQVLSPSTEQQKSSNTFRGAGAILQSSLCFNGWQFPKIILTEIDEKLLFDIEIKIKMGHDSVNELLNDCLIDYPAPTLLSHPGLIHSVLDVIGSNSHSNGTPSSPKCFQINDALIWLEKLMKRLIVAYEAQLDGRTCSLGTPSSSSNSDSDSMKPADTLATNITNTIQNMRYPSITMEDEGLGFVSIYGEPIVRSSIAMHNIKTTANGVSPSPSLAGFAFACCAASLPLLQTKDTKILPSLTLLLKSTLPFIKEPTLFDNICVSNVGENITSKNINDLRVQHLLNRIDKILSVTCPSLHKITQMSSYDNNHNENENCTLEWLGFGACDSSIIVAVNDILSLVSPSSVRPLIETYDSNGSSQYAHTIGSSTIGIIRHLCTFSNTLTNILLNTYQIQFLWNLIEMIDNSSYKSLKHCQYILMKHDNLQKLLMNDNNTDEAELLKNISGCLLEVMDLLDVDVDNDGNGSDNDNKALVNSVMAESIVPATLELLSRSNEIANDMILNMAIHVSTKVMASDSLKHKMNFIVGLTETITAELAAKLLEPNFLYSLLVTCVLEKDQSGMKYANAVDGDEESDVTNESLSKVSSQLLGILLGSGIIKGNIRELFMKSPNEWSLLLLPLKLLDWSSYIYEGDHDPISTAIRSFATNLEQFCSKISKSITITNNNNNNNNNNTNSPIISAYEKSQLIGLFHVDSDVRSESASKIRNNIEKYYASTEEYKALAESNPSRILLDPFRSEVGDEDEGDESAASPYIHLTSWDRLYHVQNKKKYVTNPEKVKVINNDGYDNLKKLTNIAFGEQTIPIRLAAMRQLSSLLCHSTVISIAETSFLIYIASECCEIIGDYYHFYNNYNNDDNDNDMMDISDARLCVDSSKLLRLLISRSKRVRNGCIILQENSNGNGNANTNTTFSILPIIIASLQLSSSYDVKDCLLGGEVRLICTQIICLYSISDIFNSSYTSHLLDNKYGLINSDSNSNSNGDSDSDNTTFAAANMMIPSVYANSLRFPVCNEKLEFRYSDSGATNGNGRDTGYEDALVDKDIFNEMNMKLLLCNIKCLSKGNHETVLLNNNYLTELVAASYINVNNVIINISSVICKSIALAPSHSDLRSIISIAQTIIITVPNVSYYYGHEKIDLALERLLKTPPQTQNDMITLTSVIKFLNELFQYLSTETKTSENFITLYENVINAILFPLYGLMQLSASSRPSSSQLKEYQAYSNRECLQLQLMQLLKTLSSLPADFISNGGLKAKMTNHPLGTFILDSMSIIRSSTHQSIACDIVYNLMSIHLMFGINDGLIATNSLESLFHTGSVNVIENVIKTTKLLRKPDSVQGFGPLLSSMKILNYLSKIALYYTKDVKQIDCDNNEMNWRWLIRLFYDRRADIRLLAIEIYSKLRKIDRYFDVALEAVADDDMNDNDNSNSNHSNFPLSKFVNGIAFDETECLSVRFSALRVLIHSPSRLNVDDHLHLMSSLNGNITSGRGSETNSLLGEILSCVHEQLSFDNVLLGSSSLTAALSILIETLTNENCNIQAKECILGLKLIPRVMSLLCGNPTSIVEKMSFRRVGVDIISNSSASITGGSNNEWFQNSNSNSNNTSICIMNKNSCSSYGWKNVWAKIFNGTCRMNMHIAMCLSCRFLQLVQLDTKSLNINNMFNKYLYQCNLIQGLLSCLSSDIFTSESELLKINNISTNTNANTNTIIQAEGRGFAGLSDLLSDLVLKDGNGITHLGNDENISNVFQSLSYIVSRMVTFVCNTNTNINNNYFDSLNSLLRLLCILLEKVPNKSTIIINNNLFMNEIIKLKVSLNNSKNVSSIQLLLSRVDIVLAILMQRSPSLSLNKNILTNCMIIIVKNARLLYDSTQKAMEAKTAANSSATRKGASTSVNIRLSLWSNMMIVQSALGSVCCDPEETRIIAENVGFHKALGLLLDCSDVWLRTDDNNTSTPMFTSLYAFMNASTSAAIDKNNGNLKYWIPSFAQIAITGLSLSCSFCRNNNMNKNLLLTSNDMRIKDGVGHVWGALDAILELTTSSKVSNTVRLLSSSLFSTLLSNAVSGNNNNGLRNNSNNFMQKSKTSIRYSKERVMQALDTALQQAQNKTSAECVALLLEVLSSCFIAECACSYVGSSSASNTGNNDYDHLSSGSGVLRGPNGMINKISRENRKINADTSMPTLLKWTWESYKDSPVVVTSLIRFIGKLTAPSVIGNSNSNNATFSRKQCLAVATSKEALQIIVDASNNANATVSGMAALTMWSSLHSSEQARANLKKYASSNEIGILSFMDSEVDENTANVTSRIYGAQQIQNAKEALKVLFNC
jgi:hypothetical protein